MSHERVIKVLKENGETWPVENVAVSGQVWDMRMNEVVGELECKVTGEGLIEVRFPEMGIGRYIFAVNGVSDDGQMVRIIEGYIGYEGPEMVEDGVIEGKELLIYIDGERRRALFGRNKAWEEKYKLTQEVAGQLEAVDKKLERAEKLNESINDKLNEFVVPDESTGTWIVGGEDTGKPYKGRDGIDGVKIQRIEVANVEDIPTSGETCNGGYLYYVSGRVADQSKYILQVGGQIYIRVEREDVNHSIQIANSSYDFWIDSRNVDSMVEEINSWDETWVRAEKVNQNTIKLITKSGFARIDCETSYAWMTIYPAYQVYAWLNTKNGQQWVNTSEAFEAGRMPTASITDVGGVKIVGSVGYGYEYYELPTNSAIKTCVDSAVGKCAKSADLNKYATKEEVSDLASKSDIAELATKEELEQVATQLPANVVTSLFGKKIVELSETEYSLLDSYDKDTYYLTYAD